MRKLLKETNNLGVAGVIASVLATLFVTGIIYLIISQIFGFDLAPIDNYLPALLAWLPFVIAGYFGKYYFFIQLTKWNFWLGKYEFLMYLIMWLVLPLTGDLGA